MANYINQIYEVFHNLPDSHVLIIEASGDEYTFTASAVCDEAVFLRTQKLFKEIFPECPFQEEIGHLGLTKAIIRQIFVKMAVFDDKGPPLDFGTLEEFEHVLLDQAPEIRDFTEDKARTSGKGFEGLCERVYLQWHHYFTAQTEQDPDKIEIRQAEFLTSRMADREFQEGAYIYLADREIYQVDKIIVREGAYISILKNISDPTKVKIVCRGTAMRRTATDGLKSGVNDLQYEIGNGGIQAAWPLVAEYLAQQGAQELEIYGKSLGGAHAQRLAILVMKHSNCLLNGLTTVCSVGVGSEAEELFKNLVENDARYHNLNLAVIRNGGETEDDGADYIPCVGGVHLGATVDPEYLNLRVYYIHPTSGQIYPPNQDQSFFQKGARFVSSFSDAHVRQTTLTDFSFQRLDREDVQSALTLGATLERQRRWFAYRNAIPFTDFVNSPLILAESTSAQKVTVIASYIFLVLFYVGFMVCLFLQPGSLVYQGNGIILTLPAIIMVGGAGLSLTTIAIGSCSWWLSSRKRESVHLSTSI